MGLVTTTEMFKKAYDGGYAIGAFNVNNMEIVQGITEAAKDLEAPLILQVSKGARAYANHTYLTKLVEAAIIESLKAGEKVQLSGFGTFEVRERAERKGRNPKTGEVVTVPACKYLAFVSAKAVKETLN